MQNILAIFDQCLICHLGARGLNINDSWRTPFVETLFKLFSDPAMAQVGTALVYDLKRDIDRSMVSFWVVCPAWGLTALYYNGSTPSFGQIPKDSAEGLLLNPLAPDIWSATEVRFRPQAD